MPRWKYQSVAKRCRRPISTGFSRLWFRTQAPSQSTSTGQTRAQLAPSGLASRITRAAPRTFSLRIFWMKLGMSMCVGQAVMQGASKQKRQREDSTNAWAEVRGFWMSAKLQVYWVSVSRGARFFIRASRERPGRRLRARMQTMVDDAAGLDQERSVGKKGQGPARQNKPGPAVGSRARKQSRSRPGAAAACGGRYERLLGVDRWMFLSRGSWSYRSGSSPPWPERRRSGDPASPWSSRPVGRSRAADWRVDNGVVLRA